VPRNGSSGALRIRPSKPVLVSASTLASAHLVTLEVTGGVVNLQRRVHGQSRSNPVADRRVAS
jgi:hypothetical protein